MVVSIGALPGNSWAAAASSNSPGEPATLLRLAESEFPNLTRAERALLEFADIRSHARDEIAVSGTSSSPDDPSNDPAHASEWSHERDIRASMIRWLCVDPDAIKLVDPEGVRVMGARIIGGLNLSHFRVPFAIQLRKCLIRERLLLTGTAIPSLDLRGSHVGEIDGKGLIVGGDLKLGDGFRASGETVIENAKIGGELYLGGGHFNHSAVDMAYWAKGSNTAIDGYRVVVGSDLMFCCGFEADGLVDLGGASIADLFCGAASFSNPNQPALNLSSAEIGGVTFGNSAGGGPQVSVNGVVNLVSARIKTLLWVEHLRIAGGATDNHGVDASAVTAQALGWRNVTLENGAYLKLTGAKLGALLDEKKSWPKPGKLSIAGLTYNAFGPAPDSPWDVPSRLEWIALDTGFNPQAYRQLAQVYRDFGADDLAVQVLIAGEDARYANYGVAGSLLGGFLKTTIGYGHRPLLAILWSVTIVLVGWPLVAIGARAGVMAPTWPENKPPEARKSYEELSPLLYSLDVFLPFVNLHQEHYWWPDANASGQCTILNRNIRCDGRVLRYYLWLQIMAGWLLSAIFVAGVTGLVRSD